MDEELSPQQISELQINGAQEFWSEVRREIQQSYRDIDADRAINEFRRVMQQRSPGFERVVYHSSPIDIARAVIHRGFEGHAPPIDRAEARESWLQRHRDHEGRPLLAPELIETEPDDE